MEIKEINPANRPGKSDEARKRIPMSVPVRKLEAPDIPGYHLHWFRGSPDRIARAQDAGYEFVHRDEVKVNYTGIGGSPTASGNTDMGSQVSVVAGEELGPDGQAVRLVLMKIKQEYYEQDQKIAEDRNEQVAAALRGGMLGAENDRSGDAQHRYVDKERTQIPAMFRRKKS